MAGRSRWTAGPWRYAKRWPANAAEDNDDFWVDLTARHLAAADKVPLAEAEAAYRVRRRVWSVSELDAAAVAKVAELRAAHQRKRAALLQSLGLDSAPR